MASAMARCARLLLPLLLLGAAFAIEDVRCHYVLSVSWSRDSYARTGGPA
jgi:hypothetical protein